MGWAVKKPTINNDWQQHLDSIFQQAYFADLLDFLDAEIAAGKIIYPNKNNWFRAFLLSTFTQTKVVILGQDPYHQPNVADGLSFSTQSGKIPPSLKNILQELESDLAIKTNNTGDLSGWAKQGVLLLNSFLTVEKSRPESHQKTAWSIFTDAVIEILNAEKNNVVFMLWGGFAAKKAGLINQNRHLLLASPHPSPLSAYRGFFGCRHFSQANYYLKSTSQKPINWAI